MDYINWLLNDLYYKWVKLTGKPDETYEENGWRTETYIFNFGFFTHVVKHNERIDNSNKTNEKQA